MTHVTVLYPAEQGRRFDLDYYMSKHIPMFRERMGAAMKQISVEKGTRGGMPGSPAPFVAVLHTSFDSAEAFAAAFAPHAAEIMADVPKYTDIQPVLLLSEDLL